MIEIEPSPEESEVLHQLIDTPEERFDADSLVPIRPLLAVFRSVLSGIKGRIGRIFYLPTASDYHGN